MASGEDVGSSASFGEARVGVLFTHMFCVRCVFCFLFVLSARQVLRVFFFIATVFGLIFFSLSPLVIHE